MLLVRGRSFMGSYLLLVEEACLMLVRYIDLFATQFVYRALLPRNICNPSNSIFTVRGPRADLGYVDYRLGKQGRSIVVYAPVYRIKTDITLYSKKTIGVITTKGQGDVLMAAHSGFRRGGDHDEKCLDTEKVYKQTASIYTHSLIASSKMRFSLIDLV